MTNKSELPTKETSADTASGVVSPELLRTGGWVAAASMGIGSAALVAALLYANRGGKPGKKPE